MNEQNNSVLEDLLSVVAPWTLSNSKLNQELASKLIDLDIDEESEDESNKVQ
ncbi:hypothetical protein [Bacteriovorax sp. Seq25_V]|uniref:hypothetical protein n=1 Tax=Bacteriovorax sp. Seq25_V TaxID=1201288 RepID=UPI0018E0067B|nr:hypothetical protein [Bacteriovorax sp. Seq25_V]